MSRNGMSMKDSESLATIMSKEVKFLQRYSWEQVQHLGQSDYSPATNWLQDHGLTNLDAGRFSLALEGQNIQVPLATTEPSSEFQSPWNDREEFQNRFEELTTYNRKKPT